tara:strand:+ start:3426 stop:4058 length:633 start_codon:yes stop_codon:yes gene_type:complete
MRTLGTNDPTELDGGRAIKLANTPSYNSYIFYLAPRCSIGKKQLDTGTKTVMVNTGLLFITVETKEPGKGKKYTTEIMQYNAGQIITFKKGNRYTYSTGNGEAELLVIESGDLTEKTLEQPLAQLDGQQQYQIVRNPRKDISNVKPRKRMTKEEREAFGEAYALARGHVTPKQKNDLSKSIARGDHLNPPQSVVGVNPTPMGDIGEDYLG